MDDLLEKYQDMTDEEFKALPKEEQDKIKAEMEAYTQKMLKENEKAVKEAKEKYEQMSDEEKAALKKQGEEMQAYYQKLANQTEDERLADMLNPETMDHTEEELLMAQEMMAKYEGLTADEVYAKEMERMGKEYTKNETEKMVKRGLWSIIKRFIRKLFG
jgi:small-conductance mechanosensitive channel